MPEAARTIVSDLVMFTAGAVAATVVWLDGGWRRWLLWTFRCRRGRRCANVVFDGFDPDGDYPPAGALVTFDYTCHSCETPYRLSVLVGEDGAFTVADRTIVGRKGTQVSVT